MSQEPNQTRGHAPRRFPSEQIRWRNRRSSATAPRQRPGSRAKRSRCRLWPHDRTLVSHPHDLTTCTTSTTRRPQPAGSRRQRRTSRDPSRRGRHSDRTESERMTGLLGLPESCHLIVSHERTPDVPKPRKIEGTLVYSPDDVQPED